MSTVPLSDQRLSFLMDLMRDKHVINLSIEGISIEIHPSAWEKSVAPADVKASADAAEASKRCHCGHMPYEHNELGCLCCTTGCEPPPQGVP